jgi:hypothetical protein
MDREQNPTDDNSSHIQDYQPSQDITPLNIPPEIKGYIHAARVKRIDELRTQLADIGIIINPDLSLHVPANLIINKDGKQKIKADPETQEKIHELRDLLKKVYKIETSGGNESVQQETPEGTMQAPNNLENKVEHKIETNKPLSDEETRESNDEYTKLLDRGNNLARSFLETQGANPKTLKKILEKSNFPFHVAYSLTQRETKNVPIDFKNIVTQSRIDLENQLTGAGIKFDNEGVPLIGESKSISPEEWDLIEVLQYFIEFEQENASDTIPEMPAFIEAKPIKSKQEQFLAKLDTHLSQLFPDQHEKNLLKKDSDFIKYIREYGYSGSETAVVHRAINRIIEKAKAELNARDIQLDSSGEPILSFKWFFPGRRINNVKTNPYYIRWKTFSNLYNTNQAHTESAVNPNNNTEKKPILVEPTIKTEKKLSQQEQRGSPTPKSSPPTTRTPKFRSAKRFPSSKPRCPRAARPRRAPCLPTSALSLT